MRVGFAVSTRSGRTLLIVYRLSVGYTFRRPEDKTFSGQ